MEALKASMMVAVVLAALCVVSNAMSIPQQVKENDIELESPNVKSDLERATWLDTRGLEDDFKELVYLAIQELASEGRLNSVDNHVAKQKRGRWQGFCFRRTRSGRFLPYICWKGDNKGQ